MKKITINLENLEHLTKTADGVFLAPEGEKELLAFLSLKRSMEAAEEAIKKTLQEAADKVAPNLSVLESDNLRIAFRFYGSRYDFDENQIDPSFTEVEEKIKLNTKLVDKYTMEHAGELPEGVSEKERTKSVVITEKGSK